MFKGNPKTNISFERNTCDCNCVMFDRNMQNNRYGEHDEHAVNGINEDGIEGSLNNLSVSA
jgi:hypothetical protein